MTNQAIIDAKLLMIVKRVGDRRGMEFITQENIQYPY